LPASESSVIDGSGGIGVVSGTGSGGAGGFSPVVDDGGGGGSGRATGGLFLWHAPTRTAAVTSAQKTT
jgi:hypothetical protein